MEAEHDLTSADRVAELVRYLGVKRAHFGMGVAQATAHPEVVASLTLLTPGTSSITRFRAIAAQGGLLIPPLVIHGDGGASARAAPLILDAYPGATAATLRDYTNDIWSDVLADRGNEIVPILLAYLEGAEARSPLPRLHLAEAEGEVAGITYRARGSGPPLLLFPLELAPSQWEPVIDALAERYCTLILGGPWLGVVAVLEQRSVGGYSAIIDALIDASLPPPGGTTLEVGCGSGIIARRLARRSDESVRVVGADINPYLVREAASLARREGLGERVAFREGNAESLPFPDASFDTVLTGTVLEEVDADRALAELARVVRPGGQIAVAVRAEDIPFWVGLPLRPELRAKLGAMTRIGVAARGCGDASLYRRFCTLGLTNVAMGPRFGTDNLASAAHEYRALIEAMMQGRLDPDELPEWQSAVAQATADGTYLTAWAFHYAVGTKL